MFDILLPQGDFILYCFGDEGSGYNVISYLGLSEKM